MGEGPWDDYYALLGVDEDAGGAALRHAWRRLAQRWHPDHAGPDTTAIFQKLAAAYAVLSDPIARAAYDRRRGTTARRARAPSGEAVGAKHASRPAGDAAADDAPIRRRAPGVLLMRLSRSLEILLVSGIACRISDDVIELRLDTEEAAEGGMVTIAMDVPVRCPACGGGRRAPCERCGSRGTVDDRFSAWLAVPPGCADGTVLQPSAQLPGVIRPVSFRVRLGG